MGNSKFEILFIFCSNRLYFCRDRYRSEVYVEVRNLDQTFNSSYTACCISIALLAVPGVLSKKEIGWKYQLKAKYASVICAKVTHKFENTFALSQDESQLRPRKQALPTFKLHAKREAKLRQTSTIQVALLSTFCGLCNWLQHSSLWNTHTHGTHSIYASSKMVNNFQNSARPT